MSGDLDPTIDPPKDKAYLIFHEFCPGAWSWSIAYWSHGRWHRQKTGEPLDNDRVFRYRELPDDPVFPEEYRSKPWPWE